MDAPQWNGSDDREFSEHPDDVDVCEHCGAAADEPCEQMCECPHCQRQRMRHEAEIA